MEQVNPTLLKVLSGDIVPTSGVVYMCGKDLSSWSRKDIAQMRAVLPQSSALSFPFTCFDVVLWDAVHTKIGISQN